MRTWSSTLALVLLLAPQLAKGQSSNPADAAAQQKVAREAALADPTLTRDTQDGEPAFVLSTTEDGGRVRGKIGLQSESWDLAVVLDAPLDKSSSETTLADLSELSGDTIGTLSVTYNGISFSPGGPSIGDLCTAWNLEEVRRQERIRPGWQPITEDQCTLKTLGKRGDEWSSKPNRARFDAMIELCKAHNKVNPTQKLLIVQEPDDRQAATDLLPPGHTGYCDSDELPQALKDKLDAGEDQRLKTICKEYNEPPDVDLIDDRIGECRYLELVQRGAEWEHRALRTLPQLSFFTVAYSLSEPSFKFVDPETFEQGTAAETNSSLGVSWILFRRGVSYGLSYKRRTTYKPSTETELCRPAGDTGALTCTNVRLGPPTKSEQDIVGVDVKWLPMPKLGVDVRLLYDFEQDFFNPHLLLYFLQKGDGSLSGGLDLSHDDDEDFSARVFVGVGFELFPGH